MFDPLLEQDPWIQELKAHERSEGKDEGKREASRSILLNIIQTRFPSLIQVAEMRAEQLREPEFLSALINQIILANDENAARKVLESPIAS